MIKPMVIVVQEDGDKRVPVAIGRSQKSLARQLRAKANEVARFACHEEDANASAWAKFLTHDGNTFSFTHVFPVKGHPIAGGSVDKPASAVELARKALEDHRAYRAALGPQRFERAGHSTHKACPSPVRVQGKPRPVRCLRTA